MNRVEQALEKTKTLPAQTPVEVRKGFSIRRTKGGIPVGQLRYSAHPERDPETHPEWRRNERKAYTSQADWDREMEIIDEAGGGQLVFADALIKHWKKIVIQDPRWRPDPRWTVFGGFDHGRTNPTVLLRCYMDFAGTLYFCGEYYMPGQEVWQHAPALGEMPDIRKLSVTYADPTIFDTNMQQSNRNQPTAPGKHAERAKSINELYIEQGIELFAPFSGDRSDISFAERLGAHWSNLEEREPTVKIVCRDHAEKPVLGLHNWDCPNLLWELMRTRRVKLTAQQMLGRNASEAIVDKDNHARDAMKYIIMSHPEPAGKSKEQEVMEAIRPLVEAGDYTSANVRRLQMMAQAPIRPARLGRRRR